jgi:hypothetical protein
MRAVQLARKERVAELLADWTEHDRHELGRLLAKFNDELSRDVAQPGSRRSSVDT